MRVSEIYSGLLKAADLEGRDVDATITGGEVREMEDGKKKLQLSFAELAAPLILNVTNAKAIARLHGEEITAWKGKRITLYPTQTQFGHKTVDCIRVRDTVPAQQPPAPSGQSGNGAVRF